MASDTKFDGAAVLEHGSRGGSDHIGASAGAGSADGAAATADGISLRLRTSRKDQATILDGDTVKSGFLRKKGYPVSNLCTCLPPKWKRRFCVIKGGFVFRFASPQSTKVKGTPISLEAATISNAADDEGDEMCFSINTVSKTTVLKCASIEERDDWVRALRSARARAIKVAMGHARATDDEKTATEMGNDMVQQRMQREQRDMEAMDSNLLRPAAAGSSFAPTF